LGSEPAARTDFRAVFTAGPSSLAALLEELVLYR
jgi:hypothetical protein